MPLRAAELEVLYTANTVDVEKAEKKVKDSADRIEKKPVTQKVGADTSDAEQGMDRVEAEAKKLVSERAMLQIDADITRTEKSLQRARDKVEDLQIRGEAGFEVTAETKRAEAAVTRLEQQAERLGTLRESITVDAETEKAETGLKRFLSLFKRESEEAGEESGRSLSRGLDSATRGAGEKVGQVVGGDIEGSLIAALTAIPIAGGIILGGVAIGKAIISGVQDGLQQEVNFDRLEALTGISPTDAMRIGRAAGEAYTNVFGESVEANMDTARLALQFRIIDPDASNRDAQKVVEGLSGIADVLGEDVRPVATAVTQLLRTGLARTSQEAFDILATGARNGVNASEDLLDTFTEYPALFQRLGLTGPEALGLINQGLAAGARNSDLAADALKEFQIRATDGTAGPAEAFRSLGLDAEEMTAKIARGGTEARDGLDLVLDKLRDTEDPVLRNAAAVGLFGTQAEDLGEALFALDPSSAVASLGQVEGAAQRMFDTLADNDATKMEQASRNIEVAADGIKGALAAAFSDPLEDFADFVSQNRGPVLQFFLDMANGALDFAETASDGFGDFVSGPLRETLQGLRDFIEWLPGDADLDGLDAVIAGMEDVDKTTDAMSDKIAEARDRLNTFGEPAVQLGYLNDAQLRLAEAIDMVGESATEGRSILDDLTESQDGSTRATGELDAQIRSAVDALIAQQTAAAATGEEQDVLSGRWRDGAGAIAEQLQQMGLTEVQAWRLIAAYAGIPESEITEIISNAPDEQSKVQALVDRVNTIPDGETTIYADTSPAEAAIRALRAGISAGATLGVTVATSGGARDRPGGGQFAKGAIVEFMAEGGLRGLSPMEPLAQMVPASSWRVVGDRTDVAEAYIPLDGSARSLALLAETIRRMPGFDDDGMAGAGAPSGPRPPSLPPLQVIDQSTYYSYDPTDVARQRDVRLAQAITRLPRR
ncbi:phage tail tape measure protein [Microbacterium arborescens]|uniref:phage tail tape measure protein n=1 Tax=Microbacterium arborescens TaxID=33883 RepID=UPI003C70B2FD